jgi:hypothetical protein
MMHEEHRILIRWTGTDNPFWNEWYPLSNESRLGLEVRPQCGAHVDFLILQSNVSEQEIARALHELREWIADTGPCGSNSLPTTRQPEPQSEDRYVILKTLACFPADHLCSAFDALVEPQGAELSRSAIGGAVAQLVELCYDHLPARGRRGKMAHTVQRPTIAGHAWWIARVSSQSCRWRMRGMLAVCR